MIIEGKDVHVVLAAKRCGCKVSVLKWRAKQCKLSRLTWEYLTLYGRQWKLAGRKIRMGPWGWEVKWKGQEKWVPYGNLGRPVDTLN